MGDLGAVENQEFRTGGRRQRGGPREPKSYYRLLGRDPSSLRFAEFAECCRSRGQLSEAATLCARGLMRHPNYATGHVVMGEIYYDQQLPDRAQGEWMEALRLDPHHPLAHFRLAELYAERGETRKAAAELEAALVFNPSFGEARALLAKIETRSEAAGERKVQLEAAPQDRAQERSAGLTTSQFNELLAAVQTCEFVENALLANPDGLMLAGNLPTAAGPEAGAALAVELAREARELLNRLGAGKLKSVLIRGRDGSLRCVALPYATLIAALKPEAPLGGADAEIEEAVASVRRLAQGEEERGGLSAAA